MIEPDKVIFWIYDKLPGITLTEYDQDEETLGLITTTYQVVDPETVTAPTAVAGTITKYVKIDAAHSLKIVRTISLPSTYTEKRIMAYTFPSLLDYTLYTYTDACGAFSRRRFSFSTLVVATVTISFTTTVQTITPISIIPQSLQLGIGGQISDVLIDAGDFTYTGDCTGTVDFDASSPSYTDYIDDYQGTSQIVTGESVMWKARYYRNSVVEITML